MGLVEQLSHIVGSDRVSVDEHERSFFSEDLSWQPGETAAVVVRPQSTEQVAAIVKAATAAGAAVVPRGGGWSYTRAHVPLAEQTVLLDMRSLNRIVEVNTADMYVTVECGATWEDLHEALEPHNVRTPFWGTSSGRFSTIGGGLGQNCTYYGAGRFGTLADSVLGLEVVVGDGSVIHTGSWANTTSKPFTRNFGPDLTGLFISDSGAMGIKTKASLKLIPKPPVLIGASFAFDSLEDALAAQIEMAKQRLASELYLYDTFYHRLYVQRGFRYLEGAPWTVHCTVDERDEETAQATLGVLRDIALRYGREIGQGQDLMPVAMRRIPFSNERGRLKGIDGRVSIPLHSFFPYSQALTVMRETQKLFDERRELLEKHNVLASLRGSAAANGVLIEPSILWHDQPGEFRLSTLPPEEADEWRQMAPNPEARAVALQLRIDLSDMYLRLGGAPMQLGKYYNWQQVLQPEAWAVLQQVKRALDPSGVMNPGAIGLPSPLQEG